MTAGGVIPEPSERAAVYHVGSVSDMRGVPLYVGVEDACVRVGVHVLNLQQAETFAQLFVRACWSAAHEGGD